MRKLWQEIRDPGCKTAFNWVSKAIRRMIQKKTLEQWEIKLANTELTPQEIWLIAKSLSNKDGRRAPTDIHGLSGLKYHPGDKANAIADCLENQITPHDLYEENHDELWRLESKLCSKLQIVTPPERTRPWYLQKLLNSLKRKEVCGIDGIPNECLRHLPRRLLVHLTHLINHWIRLSHFPAPWKEAKVIALRKPGKDPKFPQNLRPISLLSSTGKVFEKLFYILLIDTSGEETCLMQVNFYSVNVTARHCNV
jgi:hypothetical protein